VGRSGYRSSQSSRGAKKTEPLVTLQARAFEEGVPGARVVRLAGAHHYVFLSNEADVLRELRAFIAALRRDAGP